MIIHPDEFLSGGAIAVVGVSQRKFGGTIYRELKKRGFQVRPVHPRMDSFDGDPCAARLNDLADTIDAAVIAVSPASAVEVVDDAARSGIRKLWFQQGADFSEAIAKAEAAGIQYVSRRCVLMYARPVTGIHALHRFLARLFGRI